MMRYPSYWLLAFAVLCSFTLGGTIEPRFDKKSTFVPTAFALDSRANNFSCTLLNDDTWKTYGTDVISFLEKAMKDHDHNSHETFQTNFTQTFAPAVARSISDCDGYHKCAINSCNDIRDNLNERDRTVAFFALEIVFNVVNAKTMLRELFSQVANGVSGQVNEIVDRFTNAQDLKQKKAKHEQFKVTAMHLTSLMFFATTPFTGPLSGVMGMGEKAAAFFGAANGAFASVFSSAGAVALDNIDKSDPVDAIRSRLATAMSKELDRALTAETQMIESMLNGDKDIYGRTLIDHIKKGHYLQPVRRTKKVEDDMRRLVYATAIQMALEIDGRNWIVVANAPKGCANDHRGDTSTRVCLLEQPNLSFWANSLGREKEHHKGQAFVQALPGNQALTGNEHDFGGVTMQDVVRASYAHYLDYKTGPFENKNYDQYHKKGSHISKEGGRLAGVFHVPICLNPGGEAISKINSDNRAYPCMCGNFRWSAEHDTTSNLDEVRGLLQQTRLLGSSDWYKYCHRHQKCEKNKHDHLAVDNYQGNPHGRKDHPFKRCS